VYARVARPSMVAAVAFVATLSLVLGGVSPAAANHKIDHKVAQASDDLAAASKAVTKAIAALARARKELPAAQAEVLTATALLAQAQADHDLASAASTRAADTAKVAARNVAKAEVAIASTTGQIGDLVRAVYTQGPYVEMAAILSAATPSDFLDQLEAIRAVSRSQNQALSDLRVAQADLALASAVAQQATLRAKATSKKASSTLKVAAKAATRAAAAKANVERIVNSRTGALRVAAREKASVAKKYAALRAEQRRIRRLEQNSSHYFKGRPTGNLRWPIPGAEMVQGVGPRVHPVYGYRSCHTGVDIRGSSGTPIHSPAAGEVISVVNGGAYGLHTIISHGNGITTMYAHQSRTAVHVGEIVAQGEVIGYVGSTGWVTGPHLHWEVHVNGVPFDPMGWFGGPKVPVSCWAG